MKFFTQDTHDGKNIFAVSTSIVEITDALESNHIFARFQMAMLNRLASMMAAYYFKKHKEMVDEKLGQIDWDKVIHEAIVEKVKSRIKILDT